MIILGKLLQQLAGYSRNKIFSVRTFVRNFNIWEIADYKPQTGESVKESQLEVSGRTLEYLYLKL